MRSIQRFFRRLRNFASARTSERRLREEVEQHLALQTEENLRAGMSPTEARRRAMIKFGSVEAIREHYHDEESLPLIETLLQDVRYAIRLLRRSPAFTLIVVLTLGLGIGANASIFTLMNALMLRQLPVTDPQSLIRLGNHNDCCVGIGTFGGHGDYSLFTTDSYQYLRQNLSEFQDLAAMQAGFAYRPVVVRPDGSSDAPRSVMGEFVSGNYFRTFGLHAASGRLLLDSDDRVSSPLTAVMSYSTWTSQYHADPTIIGSTFRVNTQPVTIVGIAPRGFYGDRLLVTPPAFYLPIQTMPAIANAPYVRKSDMQWLYIIGRVKPGVSLPALQQKVTSLLRHQLAATRQYSGPDGQTRLARTRVVLTPGGAGIQAMQQQYDSQLALLMWISAIVLLIACANIANLLLVRGMARRAEISMRTALGGRRGRIIRQLLTESLLLAGLGGIAGLAVAWAGTRMLLAMAFPSAQNMPIHAGPSPVVLAFALALSLVTGIVFGLAPALISSRARPADALRGGKVQTVQGSTLLLRMLVVVQAALSLVLLVGAGLFVESLSKLEHINLRLDAANRYIVHINPQTAGYTQLQLADLYRTIVERFHALPGVEKVGISSYTPMEDDNDAWSVVVQGKPDPHVESAVVRVSPEYFGSVGTHLLLGRGIEAQDVPGSTPVAVVNQSFVKKLFKPGENPIGRHFGGGIKTSGDFEIVGVVEDTAYTKARWKDHLMFFTPLLQRVPSDKEPIDKDDSLYSGAIVLKTARPVPQMGNLVRQTLAQINPNLSVVKFQSFRRQIADQFSDQRMLARLTLLFALLALALATLGLYGVTAYSVARRTPEIGIRLALGADRAGVVLAVMRSATLQVLIGLAIGIPVALASVKVVASQLYEIKSIDAAVWLASLISLALATSLAGAIPARRAASIDPAQALRSE